MIVTFDTQTALQASGNSAGAPDIANPADYASHRVCPQNLSVLLNVTGATGTSPSLTVEVQWSNDGTNFASAATPDTFTAITTASAVVKQFPAKGRYARLKYTVTGTTPSFAFVATGYAA